MRTAAWRGIAVAGIGGALLGGAVPAGADYFGTPSIAAALVDDDNLFFAPADAQADRVQRVSPAFEGGFHSEPLAWRAAFGVDAERYERHPELDSDHAREAAAFEVSRRSTRRLTLAASASYAKTQSPGEIAPEAGIEFARRRAERMAAAPSLAFQLDRRTSGFAGYGFTRDTLEDAPGSDTHELNLGVGRQRSRRDTTSLEYRYRRLDAAAEVHASHAVLGGLERRFSERTTGRLAAGPRFGPGTVDLEAAASLSRALPRGEMALEYLRTETTVIGLPDAATTQSLGARVGAAVGPAVEWHVASIVASTESGGRRADALTVHLGLGIRITRFASLTAAYSGRAQRGRLDVGDEERIERNVVMVGVVIRAPAHDERDPARGPGRSPRTPERPWNSPEPEPGEEGP